MITKWSIWNSKSITFFNSYCKSFLVNQALDIVVLKQCVGSLKDKSSWTELEEHWSVIGCWLGGWIGNNTDIKTSCISFLRRSLCLQPVWSTTSSSSSWSSSLSSTSFLGSSLIPLLTSEVKSRRKRRFWKQLALFVVSVYMSSTPNTPNTTLFTRSLSHNSLRRRWSVFLLPLAVFDHVSVRSAINDHESHSAHTYLVYL